MFVVAQLCAQGVHLPSAMLGAGVGIALATFITLVVVNWENRR